MIFLICLLSLLTIGNADLLLPTPPLPLPLPLPVPSSTPSQPLYFCKHETRKWNKQWYAAYNDSDLCYYISNGYRRSWFDAYDECLRLNATLVSIHSEEENALVFKIAQKRTFQTSIWIGSSRDFVTSMFTWSDGSAFDFFKFTDEINSYDKCVSLLVNSRANSTFWYIENCGHRKGYVCKRDWRNGTATAIPATTTVAPVANGNCEKGWYRFRDDCYRIVETRKTFEDALSICRKSENGDLASITSQRRQNFLTALIGTSNSTSFWIGLKHIELGTFHWTDNSRVVYSNWAFTSALIRSYYSLSCSQMLNDVIQAGKWNDTKCDILQPFICQKPIAPLKPGSEIQTFPKVCPKNPSYFEYRGSCYRIEKSPLDWENADYMCSKDGAHLVSFTDVYEEALVTEEVRKMDIYQFWTGLHTKNNNSVIFEWSDERYVYYTNWGNQQPKIYKNVSRMCVFQNNTVGNWITSDRCDIFKPYVCKIHLQPKPSRKGVHKGHCPKNIERKSTPHYSRRISEWIDVDKDSEYCYFIGTGLFSWSQAYLNCRNHNGDLASFHDEHTLKLVAAQISKTQRSVWIGLHQRFTGEYTWSDESPVDFMLWSDMYPKNDSNLGCVELSVNDLTWRNNYCDRHTAFVCEAEKVFDDNDKPEKDELVSETATSPQCVSVGVFVGTTIATLLACVAVFFVLIMLHFKRNYGVKSVGSIGFENVLYVSDKSVSDER